MPLQAINFVPGGPIKSADLMQFVNLFTGAMTDQPVAFANTLTVGGSQSVGSVALRASSVAAGTANIVEVRTLPTDANPVFAVSRTGSILFGIGGGTLMDTTLFRSGVNTFSVSGLTITTAGLTVTAGNVGIGAGPAAQFGIYMPASAVLRGSIQQAGMLINPTGDSTATNQLAGVIAQPSTAAAAFTANRVIDFCAPNPGKGAGSTITNAYGLLVDPITSGGTNNYGVDIGPASGGSTDNLSLRAQGAVRFNGLGGFVASDHYLVIDAAGNIHRSAIGPAS